MIPWLNNDRISSTRKYVLLVMLIDTCWVLEESKKEGFDIMGGRFNIETVVFIGKGVYNNIIISSSHLEERKVATL